MPNFQKLMLPALQTLSEGDMLTVREIGVRVASKVGLDDDETAEMVPSGRQTKIHNRVSWAVCHMKHAGLVEWVRKGTYQISADGKKLIATRPQSITVKLLGSFEQYRAWTSRRKRKTESDQVDEPPNGGSSREAPPSAEPDQVRSTVARALAAEILKQVRNSSSSCLDRIVADLMAAIGYSRADAESTWMDRGPAQSQDGGSLWIDPLGVVKVYLKADHRSRSSPVSDLTLREFAATMVGTDQGVFVTTSTFSPDAVDYLKRSPMRIALIDGERLADLLAKHGSWIA